MLSVMLTDGGLATADRFALALGDHRRPTTVTSCTPMLLSGDDASTSSLTAAAWDVSVGIIAVVLGPDRSTRAR
jgi:hypothetical protein